MTPRAWFTASTAGFVEVVQGAATEDLDAAGLGQWDIRALLGHTTRAFLTTEKYLADGEAHDDPGDATRLSSAAEYYRATFRGLADPVEVTRRGREAGAALGPSAVDAALGIAGRVAERVAGTDDDASVQTPVGRMRLIDYLPSRALELTAHTIDLADATGQTIPVAVLSTVPDAISLTVRVGTPAQQLEVLRAITGRQTLPPGFNLLGVSSTEPTV